MVCRCRDGTYGPECCSRGRGGAPKSSATRPNMTYGSTTLGRAANKSGKGLIHLGTAQFMGAHLAEPPPSKKIWRGMTKRQAKTHAPHELRDGKKYDWRPKGDRPLDGFRDANLLDRDKFPQKGRGGVRTRHWERMPKDGSKYSVTTEYDRQQYKRGQARAGIAKGIGGAGMRLLGTGMIIVQLGTYAHWLYKDPSLDTLGDIALDLIGWNQAVVAAETQARSGNWYHPGTY